MYLLILYFSFASFLVSILYGRYIGISGSVYITVFCIFMCNISSIFLFYEVSCLHTVCYIDLANWINLDLLDIKYNFLFDSLTVVMLFVITTISLFAHIYSVDYMHSEAHLTRFLSYLSLFTFCMVILVTANNLLQLFVGWEGVGLCSYLLINFWFLRIQANKSALKALLVNKLSDLCLVLGVSLVVFLYHSVDYSVIFTPIIKCYSDNVLLFGGSTTMFNIICLLLFIGAMGKSAQIGLHIWLPDAMEGPTPVSSLIHAATMVTAGVFLVVRMSFFFEFANSVSLFVIIISALTIFFSSTIGMLQNDIKKVIAYSTCSQIGYMLFVCGYSGYAMGMFHLFNHAFFKALLFLTAGSIIHASSSEQDMRRIGGLIKVVPFSYISFFVGSASLMGLPFLTGYYSKDAIIEFAYSFIREFYVIQAHSMFIVRSFYFLSVVSILFTSVYSVRMLYLLFLCEFNGLRIIVSKIADSPFKMGVVLFCLVLFSVFVGSMFFDAMIGLGTDFWQNSLFVYNALDYEFAAAYAKMIPVIYSLYGALLCLLLYKSVIVYKFLYSLQIYSFFHLVFYFFNRRWLFDKLYNEYLVQYVLVVVAYSIFFKLFDKGIVDYVGPSGVSLAVQKNVSLLSRLQTGFVYHYAGIVLNIFLILFVMSIIDLDVINSYFGSLSYTSIMVY